MSSLKNPLTEAHGIPYSCYVASWLIAGGNVISKDYNAWLCSLGLTDKDIRGICELVLIGTPTLQDSARQYVKALKQKNAKKITQKRRRDK